MAMLSHPTESINDWACSKILKRNWSPYIWCHFVILME